MKLDQLESIIIESGLEIMKFKKNNIIQKKIINNHTKTNIDFFADRFIKRELNKLKKIPIISEESYNKNTKRPDKYFIIDPIDGTLSLLNNYKTWVTQIAYIEKGEVLFSAIFEPELNNLYSGCKENGIFYNKNKFSNKKIKNKKITFIDNTPKPNILNKKLMKFYPESEYLESGSLSLKICKIIYGLANIFIKNVYVRDWDIAPPLLLAKLNDVDIFDLSFDRYTLSGSLEKKGLIVCNNQLTKNLKNNFNSCINL